ncbi:hypothetical protein AXF42_Ash016319 [Apostasia shenzhenica]|uniref:Uncharacterized protein n=1 Tax=Apostasia shenzhenica TaxID=1088818 RepID=A0A2H9ZXI3_9ASPA|nr:hypothetical protein AXF42_Ash016319 [Apostasia shenzhenica]
MAFIIRVIIVVLLAATMASVQSEPESLDLLRSNLPGNREKAMELCKTAWSQYQKNTGSYHITCNCNNMKAAHLMDVKADGDALIYIYSFRFPGTIVIYEQVEISLRFREWIFLPKSKNNDGEAGVLSNTWVDEVIVTQDREL